MPSKFPGSLLYWTGMITSGLLVIRPESAQSANGVSNLSHPNASPELPF